MVSMPELGTLQMPTFISSKSNLPLPFSTKLKTTSIQTFLKMVPELKKTACNLQVLTSTSAVPSFRQLRTLSAPAEIKASTKIERSTPMPKERTPPKAMMIPNHRCTKGRLYCAYCSAGLKVRSMWWQDRRLCE